MSQAHNDTLTERLSTIELTPTERHSLLAVDRRRLAIEILAERRSPIELEELATAVAARETDGAVEEITEKEVAISLHHVHLPKLAEADVVDAYPTKGRIELADLLRFP